MRTRSRRFLRDIRHARAIGWLSAEIVSGSGRLDSSRSRELCRAVLKERLARQLGRHRRATSVGDGSSSICRSRGHGTRDARSESHPHAIAESPPPSRRGSSSRVATVGLGRSERLFARSRSRSRRRSARTMRAVPKAPGSRRRLGGRSRDRNRRSDPPRRACSRAGRRRPRDSRPRSRARSSWSRARRRRTRDR